MRKHPSHLVSVTVLTFVLSVITTFNEGDVQAKFRDVTSAVGLGTVGPSYGNPIWGDFNNDGNIDIVVPRHNSKPSLYQNNGDGKFTDVLELSGITPASGNDRHGWAWGDYDNDGNLDLFITNGACRGGCIGGKKDELWKGNGNGTFTNVTSNAGVTNTNGRGRSVSWIDYNNDGFLDLFVLNYQTNSILYKNNGDGTFTDDTNSIGLNDISGATGSWADYNNDGSMDLLVAGDGKDRLFKNDPLLFTFTEVTSQAGFLSKKGKGISWGDYNNDGYLDLYITRGNSNIRNSLIWNPGKIVFGDVERYEDGIDFTTTGSSVTFDLCIDNTYEAGKIFLGELKTNPTTIPFTVSMNDPLLNGKPTYMAGTDMGIFIWKDTSGTWHIRYSGTNKWPAFYGVLITDGNFTTVTPTFKPVNFKIKDTLYRNNGNGSFSDVTDSANMGKRGNHQASIWGDFNNDGFLDLYVTDGGNVSASGRNILYKNNGDGTFTNGATYQGVNGTSILSPHSGAAWGDFNNDGFLDLIIKNGYHLKYPTLKYPLASGPDVLYRNNGNSNHWLKVILTGTTSNRLGIGVKLTLSVNGKIQYREVNGGGEFYSQGSGPVHFGLGTATVIDSLVIKWPSGIVQTLTNVSAGQTITVTEN